MGKDWKEELNDIKDFKRGKGDDEEPKHKKKGGKRKPWVLQHRYVGSAVPDKPWHNKKHYDGNWFDGWGKYKSERDAKQALENHLRKGWIYVGDCWESRIIKR